MVDKTRETWVLGRGGSCVGGLRTVDSKPAAAVAEEDPGCRRHVNPCDAGLGAGSGGRSSFNAS